jgi:hypothetical protein
VHIFFYVLCIYKLITAPKRGGLKGDPKGVFALFTVIKCFI